ncbi:hypothetical protein [Streptomyces mexicanus]|uniref:hypothetical protein n=1 Tax=Streptomyces mexicanus TaxID=178566 RepID=UPI0031ED4F4C
MTDFLPGPLTLGLYAVAAVCAIALLMLRLSSARDRRNAGFATRAQLRRYLSAKAVLRASEIRPSLRRDGSLPGSAIDLSKAPRPNAS